MSDSLPICSDNRPSVFSLDHTAMVQWCQEQGQPKFRADQIFAWLYQKRVAQFEDMLDLPKALRQKLADSFHLFRSEIINHQIAKDRTEKLLLQLTDGKLVECVLMREPKRNTVCISSQVGCAMGCVFCASGLLGLDRSLTSAEILEQVAQVDRLQSPEENITNIVLMGIGEPLANLPQVIPTLQRFGDAKAFGLGARRITISTVGLPPKMRELAEQNVPWNLAVSLHAPNDQLRSQIVPTNRNIGVESILQAADEYFKKTGRRVTYEYILLAGVNDQPEHAKELANLLQKRIAHVNLIPMNGVEVLDYQQSDRPATENFRQILDQRGIPVTVRKRKGADIDAACGQLRLRSSNPETGHFPILSQS